MMYNSNKNRCGKKGFFFLLFIPVALAALGGVIMLLWNAILPDLLNVSKINYWQALGLFVLSRILFGGFSGGKKHHMRKNFSREKFMNMSEEEKEAFRAKWKERCGH